MYSNPQPLFGPVLNVLFILMAAALIALAVPVWLFFGCRRKLPYFARGVLAGSIAAVVGLAGFLFFIFMAFRGVSW